ncbi:hypothetical protein QBC46DRAFT_434490 [Diplogelasinospora grovesii]|uniref:BTB domain-containing protein n=1 Tax=Diplogelasinospora grovesii TaxID=303347 RepID=A0AAN6N8W5_9PEZI|nr:hypothetical protein QBC46DRAFT_434490 [Diplogelasinospora grovesii]
MPLSSVAFLQPPPRQARARHMQVIKAEASPPPLPDGACQYMLSEELSSRAPARQLGAAIRSRLHDHGATFDIQLPGKHKPADRCDMAAPSSGDDANCRQLREFVRCLRTSINAPVDALNPGLRDVDDLYKAYMEMRDCGISLCRALAGCGSVRPQHTAKHSRVGSDVVSRRTATGPRTSEDHGRTRRSTFAGDDGHENWLTGATTHSARPGLGAATEGAWLEAVIGWRGCLEQLIAGHKKSLGESYSRHEHFATPEILEALCTNKEYRAQVVGNWVARRPPSARSGLQATKWEERFEHYDRLVRDLTEITELLRMRELGTPPARAVQERTISPHGNAVLEFANDAVPTGPVLRFRVSSHMLAETSPVFSRVFTRCRPEDSVDFSDEGEIDTDLPPPPAPFVCADGSRVLLYRMPQLERDKDSALTILLHAAHMHHDQLPRDIAFEQFVALAEAAIRYRCTKPLEPMVEHRWLPQWIHKATENMPDGLVIVSYAFGLRRLFTRATKTAILNIADAEEVQAKNWPSRIKDKIWAVRCAKMAQVHAACSSAVEEYLRPPVTHRAAAEAYRSEHQTSKDIPADDTAAAAAAAAAPNRPGQTNSARQQVSRQMSKIVTQQLPSASLPPPRSPERYSDPPPLPSAPHTNHRFTLSSPVSPPGSAAFVFTSTPKCPKGSHWCDATNLGWLMLVFNELQVLDTMLKSPAVSQSGSKAPSRRQSSSRSLAQVLDTLRSMASRPYPAHGGNGRVGAICDPAPAFRSAVNDIYNSIPGLTLHETNGHQHGWALSRYHKPEPQTMISLGRISIEPSLPTPESDVVDVTGMRLFSKEGRDAVAATSAAARVFGEERICLKILQELGAFDDLHAAVLSTRTIYDVYKKNEPALRRKMVRASRRRTMTALSARQHKQRQQASVHSRLPPAILDSAEPLTTIPDDEDKVQQQLHQHQQWPQSRWSDDDNDDDEDDNNSNNDNDDEQDSDNHDEEQGNGEGNAERRSEQATPQSRDTVPPLSGRAPEPNRHAHSPVPLPHPRADANYDDVFSSMTEEEARRILWPEQHYSPPSSFQPRPQSPPLSPQPLAMIRERTEIGVLLDPGFEEGIKFRADMSCSLLRADEKTLEVTGDKKQLIEDFDRRVGLIS